MLLPQLGHLELRHLAEAAYSAMDPQLLLAIQVWVLVCYACFLFLRNELDFE